MKIEETALPGVLILTPRRFGDARGWFSESWNRRTLQDAGLHLPDFVQDNHSFSAAAGTLRGLHYQGPPHAQGKLVRVVQGEVFDVAVDIRRGSPTFGQWAGAVLSAENRQQLWIPPGFAHAFLTLSETAEFLYKTTDYYAPECERCIAWDDPDIGIEWPLDEAPVLSEKDRQGVPLARAEVFE